MRQKGLPFKTLEEIVRVPRGPELLGEMVCSVRRDIESHGGP